MRTLVCRKKTHIIWVIKMQPIHWLSVYLKLHISTIKKYALRSGVSD